MQKSEQINEIAMALSQFQGEVEDTPMDAQGFGYKYATLGAVLALVRPILAKYDLAIVQAPKRDGDRIALETMLVHKSGQWLSETLSFDMPEPITNSSGKKKNTAAQDCGGIISYMRRYALTSMLGITKADDDAVARDTVHQEPQEPKQYNKPQQQAYAKPVPEPVHTIGPEDLAELGGYILSLEVPEAKIKSWLDKAKVSNITELPAWAAKKIIKQCKDHEEKLQAENEEQTKYQYEV
jgi:hypothetical protein